MIKLDRDIEQSDYVRFICLTKTESQVVPGDTIYAIGWGYTENSRNQGKIIIFFNENVLFILNFYNLNLASRFLMQVDLIVQRKENCLIQYIDSDQFCAGNVYQRKDTCNVSWNFINLIIYTSIDYSSSFLKFKTPLNAKILEIIRLQNIKTSLSRKILYALLCLCISN